MKISEARKELELVLELFLAEFSSLEEMMGDEYDLEYTEWLHKFGFFLKEHNR